MCKYSGNCELCHYPITVHAEQLNLQDTKIKISSECPNLQNVVEQPVTVDAMREVLAPKEKSDVYALLRQDVHLSDCTAYDIIHDAIGKNLGRYYELA